MQKFITPYPTTNCITTSLQPVFDIMQQFKYDLLKHGNPLTFIKYNLLDKGMLPLHKDKNCTFDKDGNIIYGSLKTANGYTAIDINLIKGNDDNDYCYTVFAEKFSKPTIGVTYDNTGKPITLCFNYENLPGFLNNVFCNLGIITNKDNYKIKMGDYLIDVYIDTDCFCNMYDVGHCNACVYITLKI